MLPMSDETTPRPHDPHVAHRAPLPEGTPAHIGRYDVLRLLGGGTFGRVYLAFDPEIERYVAIKTPILPPDSHREFLREARIVAQLHHPNICPVYDVGVHGGLPFIVMRYVSGGTLETVLERGLPPPTDALRITGQIAKGLNAAHARGVFHRDLKPANVLFDEEKREVLLADFGIARWTESGTVTTGGIKGSPAYMAPEQWGPGGQFGDISARTDVYSLGVVLFRLLTGAMLFAGNATEQMFHHCFTAPRRPSAVCPNLDTRLDELCLKALAKPPSDRYASMRKFADAIAGYLRSPARTDPVPQRSPATDDEVERLPRTSLPPPASTPRRSQTKPPEAFDVWFVDANTVYNGVPYAVLADWTQKGQIASTDRVRSTGTEEVWLLLAEHEQFSDYLPQSQAKTPPKPTADSAQSEAPVALGVPDSAQLRAEGAWEHVQRRFDSIEEVPENELNAALFQALRDLGPLPAEDLIAVASQWLGFKRVNPRIRDRVASAINFLTAVGKLAIADENLVKALEGT
jgi:serine/threonine protein kinase